MGGSVANLLSPLEGLVNGGWTGLRNGAETAASLVGDYYLPGSSLLTDQLASRGSQAQLDSPVGEGVQLLSSLAGNGFGSNITGVPASPSIGSDLTSIGNGIGGLGGDATLGTDIGTSAGNAANSFGTGLSNEWGNFTDGLSSLYGGTPQPEGDLAADYNGITSGAPGSSSIASAASTPNISLGNTLTTGSGNIGSVGGGSLGSGGTDALAGESIAAPSASGVGGDAASQFNFGSSPIGGTPTLGGTTSFGDSGLPSIPQNGFLGAGDTPAAVPDLTGAIQTPAGLSGGVGGTQGGSALSNLFGNVTGNSNVPSDSFNYGFDGNPTGASALSPSDPAYAATEGSGNMGVLSSLYGSGAGSGTSGAGTNIMNGLLRGGLGYLLNSPNNAGKDAINTAVGQGQAAYAPYLAAGNQAEGELANLYGNNGTAAQTAAQQNFQNTPGFQFAENQGINAVNANAAAMGSPLSGNNEQAVNNYAQGTADQTYNNYINQLQNMASGGASAATGSANLGLTGAGGIAQIGQNNANNRNTAIGQGLEGLFPTGLNLQNLLSGLQSGSGNNNGILNYL